jgi:predicted GNAT family acetyltransferase
VPVANGSLVGHNGSDRGGSAMTNSGDSGVDVRRNDELGRYELFVDDEVASFADFVDDGSTVVLPHTVTLPAFRNRGLAAKLVKATLDDVDRRGRSVEPTCWFVAEFIDLHPEYRHLLVRH